MDRVVYCIPENQKPGKVVIDRLKAEDPFYRYKMRQLQVQTIGASKMTRTYFINVDDVAKDLHVVPSYIPTYFAQQLGAQAKYDSKKPDRERGSISGVYQIPDLGQILEKFIREFVLCGECQYPELVYIPAKKTVKIQCKSCGFKTTIDKLPVDLKFARYVVNHPPPKPAALKAAPKKLSEATDEPEAPASKGANDGDKEEVGMTCDFEVEAVEKLQSRKGDNDDWAIDVSAEAVEARKAAELSGKVKELIGEEGNSAINNVVEGLRALNLGSDSAAKVAETGKQLKLSNRIDDKQFARALFLALLKDQSGFAKNMSKYSSVLQKTGESRAIQKIYMKEFESAEVERLDQCLEKANSTYWKKGMARLQMLYESDVIDEEVILDWYNGKPPTGKYFVELRKAYRPLIDWLNEAEEESDEEESDEE